MESPRSEGWVTQARQPSALKLGAVPGDGLRGFPLKVIQELIGHVTIEMTERYAHLSPDTRREAVGVLDRPLPLAPACDIRATRMEEAANHP